MITNTTKVSIIMVSDSDVPIMQNAMEFLDKMKRSIKLVTNNI